MLADVLDIPYYKRRELREQFPDDEDYKKKVVNYLSGISLLLHHGGHL